MSNFSSLRLVAEGDVFVLEEALRVLHVVVDVGDAAVNFSLSLESWLAHLEGDDVCEFCPVGAHHISKPL